MLSKMIRRQLGAWRISEEDRWEAICSVASETFLEVGDRSEISFFDLSTAVIEESGVATIGQMERLVCSRSRWMAGTACSQVCCGLPFSLGRG
jgi:hypothetical protein